MVGGGGGLVDREPAPGHALVGACEVGGVDGAVKGGGVDPGHGDLEAVDVGQGVALAGDRVDAGDGAGLVDDLGADR